VHVTKMHGTRNDFAIVDCRAEPIDLPGVARRLCDRRTGVGADGIIALGRSTSAKVHMRIVNADGSEAEMCGNGIRCAARWLDEAGEGDRIAFETEAGIVHTEILSRDPEYLVRVAIGVPKVEEIVLKGISGAAFADIGNPHVVIVRSDVDGIDLPAVAESVNHEPRFRDGTNVHVAAVRGGNSLSVRHWERGVGLTPACGTGAVACAAVAIERGLAASPVEVLVPGGRLVVEWDGRGAAYLIGSAARVFDTEVNLGAGALP
jgi:diaminopimelate epimerase